MYAILAITCGVQGWGGKKMPLQYFIYLNIVFVEGWQIKKYIFYMIWVVYRWGGGRKKKGKKENPEFYRMQNRDKSLIYKGREAR